MTTVLPASAKPASADATARVTREIALIRRIYDLLFADQPLDLLLSEGDDPVSGAPKVFEKPLTYRPSDFGAGYLGRIHRPGPVPGVTPVTAILSIPRPLIDAEGWGADRPWRPMPPLGPVYRHLPLIYEQIRYGAEMARRRRDRMRRHVPSYPFRLAHALLPQTKPVPDAARPAILIGFHWLEVGGAEKLAFDTVRWALASGLRVFVVASVAAAHRLADRLPDHPDVEFIRLDRYLPLELWPRFVEKLVLAENIRAVHIHHCQPLYDSLPQLRAAAPWLRVIDSTHIVEYANGGYPCTSGQWSNFIDTHHVISADLARFFRDKYHVVHKVALGRMLDGDGPQAVETLPPLNLRAGSKELNVAFIGRLHYQKRPVIVIAILRRLTRWAARNGVTLRATLVGEGPFIGALGPALQRSGLQDQVTLLPAHADIPGLLAKTDILLLPSNNEGLALVCYEAIQHGCIPITTDVGAQHEIVPPDLLVPLEPRACVRASVAAIDRLWRDQAFLDRQQAGLHDRFARLSADPTARDVLVPIYRALADPAASTDA